METGAVNEKLQILAEEYGLSPDELVLEFGTDEHRPRYLHERRMRLHGRVRAGPAGRLVRGVQYRER